MTDGTEEASQALVQAQALRLGYGTRTVLDRVDLRICCGDFWFLLGQNGTGKTTLLRALLGLLRPLAGEIHLHPVHARRDRLGFVPQRPELAPGLPTTVREFVQLGLVGMATTRHDRAERLAWALEHVGLQGMERHDYWSLSGGQRQRALVARALARRPALLVMDEPTAGLDPAAEESLLSYLARLNREQSLTVVCVSHDLATAARYASHVALFNQGSVHTGPRGTCLRRTTWHAFTVWDCAWTGTLPKVNAKASLEKRGD